MSYKDIAVTGLLVLGIVWFGFLTWGIFAKEERARHDVADARGQLASLEEREATLQADLDELNTSRGQEAALRDTLGVAKPGENVIIVVPPAAATSSTTTRPWWRAVLDWF
jgi:cell division protein FtsB